MSEHDYKWNKKKKMQKGGQSADGILLLVKLIT
jgi:hypothetical protein